MKFMTKASLIGFSLYVIFEAFLYTTYGSHDARFHWFTHFFVGAIAALIIMSIIAWWTKRPVRLPLLWPLLAHLFAMLPDFLFSIFSIAHEQWMDIFLFHISSHFTPGRNATWYVLFLVAVGLYLYIVANVLKAKGTKDDNTVTL